MNLTSDPVYNLRRSANKAEGMEPLTYPSHERLQADVLAAGMPLVRAVHVCLGPLDKCGTYPYTVMNGLIEWEKGEPPCLSHSLPAPAQGVVTALTGALAAPAASRTTKRKAAAPVGPTLFDNMGE